MTEQENDRAVTRQLRGGLFPAVPVPFDRSGRFHSAAQERYEHYLAATPVDGVAVWAHTGRGLLLDPAIADDVLRSWRQAMNRGRDTGGGRLLIAGAGCNGDSSSAVGDSAAVDRAVAMADRAREGGADALLVYAPTVFRGHPRQREWVADYHRAIAAVGLPMIAFYLYEAAGGISYTTDELEDVLSLPQVVSIKMATLDSVCTYQDVVVWIRSRFPEIPILTGEDRFLGYSLLRGASGALIGMGAVLPKFQKRLIEACRDDAPGEALRLTLLADQLGECLFRRPFEGYIQRLLEALVALGVIPAVAAHDPWHSPLDAAERAGIAALVERIQRAEEDRQR